MRGKKKKKKKKKAKKLMKKGGLSESEVLGPDAMSIRPTHGP